MTKALKSLVRLHRRKLDLERRDLARVHAEIDHAHKEIAALDEGLRAEGNLASVSPDLAGSYSAYMNAELRRKTAIFHRIDELNGMARIIEDRIAEGFRELKAYEIAAEAKARQARREADRREQAVNDQIGLDIHRRS